MGIWVPLATAGGAAALMAGDEVGLSAAGYDEQAARRSLG